MKKIITSSISIALSLSLVFLLAACSMTVAYNNDDLPEIPNESLPTNLDDLQDGNDLKQPEAKPTPDPDIVITNDSSTNEKTIPSGTASEETLNYYTEFLSDRINNRFIRFEFNTKDEIDLSLVFYENFMLKDSDGEYYYVYQVTNEERAALAELLDMDIELDITRCYVPEAIDFLRSMTGYEFSREELGDALNARNWTYMENWDAWYIESSDTAYRLVTCVEVIELDNGNTEIYYRYDDGAGEYAVLTIEENEDRIIFLSNRYL